MCVCPVCCLPIFIKMKILYAHSSFEVSHSRLYCSVWSLNNSVACCKTKHGVLLVWLIQLASCDRSLSVSHWVPTTFLMHDIWSLKVGLSTQTLVVNRSASWSLEIDIVECGRTIALVSHFFSCSVLRLRASHVYWLVHVPHFHLQVRKERSEHTKSG